MILILYDRYRWLYWYDIFYVSIIAIFPIDICIIQHEYHSNNPNDICIIQHEYHSNNPNDICIIQYLYLNDIIGIIAMILMTLLSIAMLILYDLYCYDTHTE